MQQGAGAWSRSVLPTADDASRVKIAELLPPAGTDAQKVPEKDPFIGGMFFALAAADLDWLLARLAHDSHQAAALSRGFIAAGGTHGAWTVASDQGRHHRR